MLRVWRKIKNCHETKNIPLLDVISKIYYWKWNAQLQNVVAMSIIQRLLTACTQDIFVRSGFAKNLCFYTTFEIATCMVWIAFIWLRHSPMRLIKRLSIVTNNICILRNNFRVNKQKSPLCVFYQRRKDNILGNSPYFERWHTCTCMI